MEGYRGKQEPNKIVGAGKREYGRSSLVVGYTKMGNSASSGTHNPPVTNTPQDRDNREKPTSHPVHRSLRTKKKSLELPDLASLSLTPAPSHLNSPNHSPRPHYRRPKPSSPIPIPSQGPPSIGLDHHYQSYPRPTLPSTTQMPDVLVQQQPHTHIPIFPPAQRHRSTPNASTRSLSRPPQAPHLPPIRDVEPGREPEAKVVPFHPETVRSTIPQGLAQEDIPLPSTRARLSPIDEPPHPVDVKISWRGIGKTVCLARAGDAGWKGRQAMERRYVQHHPFLSALLPHAHLTLTTAHPIRTPLPRPCHYYLAPITSSSSSMKIGSLRKISQLQLMMMAPLRIMLLCRSPPAPLHQLRHHQRRRIAIPTRSLFGRKAVMQAFPHLLEMKVGHRQYRPS